MRIFMRVDAEEQTEIKSFRVPNLSPFEGGFLNYSIWRHFKDFNLYKSELYPGQTSLPSNKLWISTKNILRWCSGKRHQKSAKNVSWQSKSRSRQQAIAAGNTHDHGHGLWHGTITRSMETHQTTQCHERDKITQIRLLHLTGLHYNGSI